MGVKERREREKDELRAKMLDAARKLLVDQGYEAVSMRKIAEAIEYSPTAIYQYFKDKDDLILQICEADFLDFARQFNELASVADPVERIRLTGRGYIQFALDKPEQYKRMFLTHLSNVNPEAVRERFETDQHRGKPEEDAYAFLLVAIEQAVAAGQFRSDDPKLIAQTLWAGMHGVAALAITHARDPWPDWRPVERRTGHMIDVLLRGLMA